MTKKQAARAVAFLLLAALMLHGVTELLRDRETTLASFYSEPKNSVEAIVVGSSHVNSTYVPGILWAEYGISAHNVFSWSQPMWISYHYIKEALKTQQPKVVVLELYGMMYGNSYIMPEEIDDTNYRNSFTIDPGLNYYEMLLTVQSCGLDLRNPTDFLNLVRYHSRWQHLSETAFTYNAHNQQSYLKGYGFLTNTIGEAFAPLPHKGNEERYAPYETALAYLDKIVALAEKEGFELVFTLSPYEYNETEIAIFNYLDDYAAERGIPFLNYCTTLREELGLDMAVDMADKGHTNYSGGEKITRHLGGFLKQNYDFWQPESLPNTAELDRDAGKMYRTVDVAALLEQTDTLAFFARAAEDENIQLYLMAGQEFGTLDEAVREVIRPFVRQVEDAAPLTTQEGVTLAYRDGGAVLTVGGEDAHGENGPGGAAAHWVYYDRVLARPVAYGYLTNESGTQMLLEEFTTK